MPYCSHCGERVEEADLYCARCGARQPVPEPPPGPFASLSSRNASLLCYIPLVGWIAAIVVLASQRFKTDQSVRFHAFQGLYLFVAWLVVDWAVGPFFHFAGEVSQVSLAAILKLALFATWIYMLVKTSQGVTVRLPVLGELAERSLAEQR